MARVATRSLVASFLPTRQSSRNERAIQDLLEINCVGEQALSSLIGLSEGRAIGATMAIGSTGYEPIAWWLTSVAGVSYVGATTDHLQHV